MKTLIDYVFSYWKWFFAAAALITIILLSSILVLGIRIDNSIETLTIDNTPSLILLQKMEKEYGSDEFVVISFKGDDIFSPHVLAMIDRITTKIEQVKNVERVLSLTNASVIKGDSEGFGNYPLLPDNHLRVQDPEKLKDTVLLNEIYKKSLYSNDGNATSIIAWITPVGKDDAARWQVVKEIQDLLDKEKDNRHFYFYGMPVYQKLIMDAMLRDQLTLIPITFLVIGLLLFLFFRDIRLVIIPFILIGICALWAVGFLIMAGNTLNYVTNILPIVLLVVCICDSVHIISHFIEMGGTYAEARDALKDVIARIGIPIVLTSVTTAVGFLSLVASSIEPVRDFGVFTGLGVLFALALSITLLPLVMSRLNLKAERPARNSSFGLMEKILIDVGEISHNRRGFVFAFSVVALLISSVGLFRIEARQEIIDMLKDNEELDEARRFIDVDLGGSCEFDVLFEGKGENAVIEPHNLKLIERIQDRIVNEVDETLKVISVVDFLKEMNQAMNENNPAYYRIPPTSDHAAQFLMLYSFDEDESNLESLVNFDYSQARVRMFTVSADDSVIGRKAFNESEKIISEEIRGADLQAAFTGRPKVFLDMVDSLIMGMAKSFSLAFVVILIMMITVFRSLTLGLLSTIVSIIPAIITFGVMGWLNIPLNMMTAMVPSIAIGIAVDDTIHFMWRTRKEIGICGNYKEAISRSLRSVGRPIITTSILICIGFSVFYFSELTVMTQFGFLTFTTVFAALLADLFLAPVLLLVFKPIRIEEEMINQRSI